MRNTHPRQLQFHRTQNEREPFTEWYESIRDQKTRARIRGRLDRLETGNFEEYQIDGDTAVLLLSLKTFIESQGGVAEVTKRTDIDPETLLKILSSEEAPHLDTFAAILKALGCRLSIEQLKPEGCRADRAGVDASVTPIKGTKPEMALATENK